MKIFTFYLITFLLQDKLFAQTSIVAVGDATIEKTKIAFSTSENCNCVEVSNIVRTDLEMYKHKLEVFDNELSEIQKMDYEYILSRNKETQAFELLSRRGEQSSSLTEIDNSTKEARVLGHEVADLIYQNLFQKQSIFKSKIYFISDMGINNKGVKGKQLFAADWDGTNIKQITNHNGYVFSPTISEDRQYAVYSVISNESERKNVNLYMMDLKTGEYKVISNFKGINSGAVFVPGGDEIILTLTHSGNAELYKMNIKTKVLFPLTRHFASDVDPSVSPNGETVAFLSTRAGKPMIYTLSTDKTEFNVKRVSFVGEYNASPRFSPNGEEIIFSSWLDNRFDLFRLSSKGMNLVRLTKDHGSNEGASYSPDGEFVIFSSQRILSETQDVKNLYIMTRDGDILKKVSSDLGKAESPSWVK